MSKWKEIGKVLEHELDTSSLKCLGSGGGGCINEGIVYETDTGQIFVKINSKSGARRMFDGEMVSLEALHAMDVIRVPKPIKVMDMPGGGAMLAMEYLNIGALGNHGPELGRRLARLHLKNEEIGNLTKKGESFVGKSEHYKYVDKFGFPITTCCGYLPQDNTWQDDWVSFYGRKIESQMELIDKEYGDREVRDLWSQVLAKLPKFFKDVDVKPSLMHGDLWGGNAGSTDKQPVIFDPASFYGHSEFDLAISHMFGGFGNAFFQEYHNLIPQAPGFRRREDLYQLFHYLNHWNHFGTGYRGSSIGKLNSLVKHL